MKNYKYTDTYQIPSVDIKSRITYVEDWGGIILHPHKGHCIFATRDIMQGEVLMRVKISELCVKHHATFEEFEKSLRGYTAENIKKILEHSIPAGDGTIIQPHPEHPHCYFNHSRPPNCRHYNEYYTKPYFDTVALVPINEGEELTIDYDHSSGYEVRVDDENVRDFLALCFMYGVEKRPSKLTLPAVHFKW